MLAKVCAHCNRTFGIEDAKVDSHWNSWSLRPAYCYCPYCNVVLPDVYPRSVDFAKRLKPIYVLGLAAFFACFALGVATETLGYVAPFMLFCFGGWLARSAQLKDHRIIGWFLVTLSVLVLAVMIYAA